MSGQGYEELIVLNRKLDELLKRYVDLKIEVTELRKENDSLKSALHDRDVKLDEIEIKYERLKLTGALLGEGENAVEARRKINELVREIDKCVALLNR